MDSNITDTTQTVESQNATSATKPVLAAIGTWPFAQQAVDYIVAEVLKKEEAGAEAERGTNTTENEKETEIDGGSTEVSLLDELLVSAIELVEEDKDVHTVGVYSFPNADGVLQLDAGFINATKGTFGSVLGITGFRGAIRGAYTVATNGPHTVFAGEGAERYLVEKGLARGDPRDPPVYSPAAAEEKETAMATGGDGQAEGQPADKEADAFIAGGEHTVGGMGKEVVASHDTVGIVAVRGDEVVVGCSTSGARNKRVGRVGDSAIFGSGLYAAAGVGGAAGTGDGDVIVRMPFAFTAVEAMRGGMSPQMAAEHAISRLAECPGFDPTKAEAAIVVLNMKGEYGSATTPAWKGVFTPAFADADTLKAAACAEAHVKEMALKYSSSSAPSSSAPASGSSTGPAAEPDVPLSESNAPTAEPSVNTEQLNANTCVIS